MGHAGVPVKYEPHRQEFWDALDRFTQDGQLQTLHGIAIQDVEETPFWRPFRKKRAVLVLQIIRACRLAFEEGKKYIYLMPEKNQ